MKILIISDSHDNLLNIKKALALAKKEKVKTLIHCGDVASSETLKFISDNFAGKIYAVFGNADNEKEKMLMLEKESKNLKIFQEIGVLNLKFKIQNLKLVFVHFPAKARKLAKTEKYDFVFYGHAHRPWVEIIGQTILANPGQLDNSFPTPTCALLDSQTKKLELKILN